MIRLRYFKTWLTLLPVLAFQPIAGAIMGGAARLPSDSFRAKLAAEGYHEAVKIKQDLGQTLGPIDRAIQLARDGQPDQARQQLDRQLPAAESWFTSLPAQPRPFELMTTDESDELEDRLIQLSRLGDRYCREGRELSWQLRQREPDKLVPAPDLRELYSQLEQTFREVNGAAEEFVKLGRRYMEKDEGQLRQARRESLTGAGIGLGLALLAFGLAWFVARQSLRPLTGPTAPAAADNANGPRPDQDGAFDFERTFGKYLYGETGGHRMLRLLLGAVVFVLAAADGRFAALMWQASLRDLPGREGLVPPGPGVILGILGTAAGSLLIILSLRSFARRAEARLRKDRRRPLLYLRSFAADNRMLEQMNVVGFLVGGRRESHEESLARAVADLGPLVAVGRPGEWLPPIGAARLYIRQEQDWRQVVTDLVGDSQLVILRVGQSEGFLWELRHVASCPRPQRVLFFLPREDRQHLYAYLREQAAPVFPHPLPPSAGRALFLGFGPGWVPLVFGGAGPSLWARIRGRLVGSRAPALREALNPALSQLGMSARPLPLQPRDWVVFCLLTLLVLYVVVLCALLFL
jgi:hypothetical protein